MNAINETNGKSQVNGIFLFWKHTITSEWNVFYLVVYKKTGERYIELQRVITSGATSDNEWQRVLQRMTTSDTASDNDWQRVTGNDNEWHRVTKGGTRSKNGTVYFKEWMIAILSITKLDKLLQWMDGWY